MEAELPAHRILFQRACQLFEELGAAANKLEDTPRKPASATSWGLRLGTDLALVPSEAGFFLGFGDFFFQQVDLAAD